MKKILLAAVVVIMASGCHDYKADADKLQQEKTALNASVSYKDSTITAFLSSFNEIENNLAAIEIKRATLAKSAENGELKGTQMERINENILSINELIKENKQKIASLTASLKKSNVKVHGFEAMIAKLNLQIEEKDKQVADLNTQLAEMNTKVEKLNTGTFKELQTKQVMKKTGGILGIGATKKVNSDFNKESFTAIDITKVQTIPVDAKDAKLLTTHPSDSYTIEHKGNMVNDILITNPEKFWAASKYLVVVTDK